MNYNQFISPRKNATSVNNQKVIAYKFMVFGYQNDAIILVSISLFFAVLKIFFSSFKIQFQCRF